MAQLRLVVLDGAVSLAVLLKFGDKLVDDLGCGHGVSPWIG